MVGHDYLAFLLLQGGKNGGITILQEFYQVTFRKKLYADVDSLQKDLDDWLNYYNNERTHQGKICNGRTPMETLLSGKLIWDGNDLSRHFSEAESSQKI